MKHRTEQFGFTLLELIMVMVIVAVVLSMAAPTLSNWSRSRTMVNAADEFLSMTRYARSRSISNARMVLIEFTDDGREYRLMEMEDMVFVQCGDYIRTLPEDYEIGIEFSNSMTVSSAETASSSGQNGNIICFYPSGRCDPVRVVISSPANPNDVMHLDCGTPTELFRVVNGD
jgi:type II secretion system protein H